MSDVVGFYRGKRAIKVALPDTMPELDKDQLAAAQAMVKDRDKLLFSDPGAGKTLTALKAESVINLDRRDKKLGPAKTLIVCPSIAVYTWMRWVGKVYHDLDMPTVVQVVDTSNSPVMVEATHVIVPYGVLSRKSVGLVHRLQEWGYSILIADESDNLTGWTSKRTQAVFGTNFDGGLVSRAEFAWMLTGTPIPRYNDGLYPVLRALFPDRLATYGVKEAANFLDRFTSQESVRYGKMKFPKLQVSGSRNGALLNEILFGKAGVPSICIRLKLNLPDEPVFDYRSLDFKLSGELSRLEQELHESTEFIGADRFVDPRLATGLRVLGEQMAPHVAKDVTALLQHKRREGDGQGVVVLYWHRAAGDALQGLLEDAGFKVGRISGATKQVDDAEVERAFNAGELDVVVGQIKAMGVAINLQENCDVVAFAEDSFSDAANLQAYQRVWRRGQKSVVKVIYYRALNSSLADIRQITAKKKRSGARLVLDGEGLE